MKAETNHRITAYTQALPRMRERVIAALLMLLIAAAVAVTATYAWVTLSFAPEVSGLATTLAANGSLEIALAGEDGSAPDEFDVDESVTAASAVTATNLQWGNLVNLSDPSYNINNLALRPARLNTASLLNNPLWGAVYSADGRVNNLDSNYAYVKYDAAQKAFMVAQNSFGVRAIASYTATLAEGTQKDIADKREAAFVAHNVVNAKYGEVAGTFASLGDMISAYAQDKISNTNTDLGGHFGEVLTCYYALQEAMEAQKDAYVALANFQSYMYFNNHKDEGVTYHDLTWEEIVQNRNNYNAAGPGAASQSPAIALTGLNQFINDLNQLNSDIDWMEKYHLDHQTRTGSAYYWSGKDAEPAYPDGPNISSIVDRLVGVYEMTVDLKDDGNETQIVSLSTNDISGLLSAVAGGSRKVYIYSGIMIRFEQNAVDNSYRINGRAACTIKIKYGISVSINGKAYTKASGDCYYMLDYTEASGVVAIPADATAEDTYGLVVDLWLRTNAEETCLTLEGATTVDSKGAIQRYDGVNRVWGRTGTDVPTTDSTTQGGGSCYVYYADTPEDMNRSLSLLESMKVAFVDQYGSLMATAEMDTANYYAVNGRITVPLVLSAQTQLTYTYVDGQNAEHVGRAITTMYADRPIRVTAIIYLDGDQLSNDDVLAEAEIQGRLNLQFGSSVDLRTLGSSELKNDTRVVTAEVSRTEMDYDTAVTADDLTTLVTVAVEGTTPESVTAGFLRAINNYQGTREAEMTFTKQSDGTWQTSYQFTTPGTYWLRYVTVNGVEYTLEEPQKVEVTGFKLHSVMWDQTESYHPELEKQAAIVRTSDSTHTVKVEAQFAMDAATKQPKSVQARFVREDGNTVNINLAPTSQGKWTGTGTFTTSGVYTLQYLVVDGAYRDLESLEKTLDLSLGMYVSVENVRGALTEDFIAVDEQGEKKLYERDVAVKVYDNTGRELQGLTDLVLYYALGSSTTTTVNAPLEWIEDIGKYTGRMSFQTAGRYRFLHVELKGIGTLTRCTESPVYTFISPDPPAYDAANSGCTLNNAQGIQFVPLTNDARIDGILINNANDAVAVVYYEKAGYREVKLEVASAGRFYCKLPTYQLPTGETDAEGNELLGDLTQDGTWSVAAIKVYNCYDEAGSFREENSPILWAGTDTIAQRYISENSLTADASCDFAKLSTTVSGSLNVSFTPGETELGSDTEEFMSNHYISGIGMYAMLTDDAGHVIPGKLADVTLHVTYVPDPDNNTYGYKVQANASRKYEISLNTQGEDGHRTLSSVNENWRYVGVYRVEMLTVKVGGKTLEFAPGSNGVPQKYTVTTMAPTVEKIEISNIVFQNKLLGKSGDTISGSFLDGGNPGVRATVSLGKDAEYAIMDDITMKTVLTYEGGSEANGGYTINEDNSLKTVELGMPLIGNTYSSNSAENLLAGSYQVELKYSVGGEEKTHTFTDKLQVYSKKPDVTMALASGTPTTVTVNKDAGTAASTNIFIGTNTVINDGHSAVLYASYRPFTASENPGTYNSYTQNGYYASEFAHYEMPALTFTLTNGGSICKDFSLTVPNNGGASVALTNDAASAAVTIGSIEQGTEERDGNYTYEILGKPVSSDCKYSYKTERPNVIGEQTISDVTAIVNGEKYTFTLDDPMSIVQKNSTVPSLTFTVDDSRFVVPASQKSTDGRAFTLVLPGITTSAGAASVTADEVETTIATESTSGDPDVKAKNTAIADNLNWATASTNSQEKVYTVTEGTETGSHTRFGISGTYYYKVYTSMLYTRSNVTQTANLTVSVDGVTKNTKTEELYSVTTSLDYWLVDGTKYAPGQEVTISGNSVAVAVFAKDKTLKTKTVTTDETNGQTDYYYKTECSAIVTVSNGAGNTTTAKNDTNAYRCGHYTCSYTRGDANDALKYTGLVEPTNSGYTKVGSAEAGTVRDFTHSKWERNGEPVVKTGTTTTTVQVFDANGKLISSTTT